MKISFSSIVLIKNSFILLIFDKLSFSLKSSSSLSLNRIYLIKCEKGADKQFRVR